MRFRKGLMVAILATFLGATSGEGRGCVARLGDSAQNFQRYFQALKEASLNPMERLVYSLVLVRTNNPGLPEGRL